MKPKLLLFLLMIVLTMNACSSKAPIAPTPTHATETPPGSPTDVITSADQKGYSNSAFGFGFQYPSAWFGPDEYVSDQTLRVSVGSDVVYPYGETPAQPSDIKNSYLVVIQYTKGVADTNSNDPYQSLNGMKDGESLSGPRSLVTRVRQLELGRFTGFEYISTLPETAQTEHVFTRNVILSDGQANSITVFGTPNNVEVATGADWRSVYQAIDAANQAFFDAIVASITVN